MPDTGEIRQVLNLKEQDWLEEGGYQKVEEELIRWALKKKCRFRQNSSPDTYSQSKGPPKGNGSRSRRTNTGSRKQCITVSRQSFINPVNPGGEL